jgi:hypothetical protein
LGRRRLEVVIQFYERKSKWMVHFCDPVTVTVIPATRELYPTNPPSNHTVNDRESHPRWEGEVGGWTCVCAQHAFPQLSPFGSSIHQSLHSSFY